MSIANTVKRGGRLSQLIQAQSRLKLLKPSRILSPSEFNENHLSKAKPGLFKGLISEAQSPYLWPACQKWKGEENEPLSGLREVERLQNATVDVEVAPIGRGYGDNVKRQEGNDDTLEWTQLRMPFSIFQDAFIDGKIPWNNNNTQSSQSDLVGYVAQQDLFEIAPILTEHCPTLPHSISGKREANEQWRRNLWIGGAGTFTPIHRDPYENLFAQIVGRKRVHIFPPNVADQLYLFDRSSRQSNTSSIPTEEPLLDLNSDDLDRFPLLQQAIQHPEAACAILEPGDILYIPQGFYHCIASLSISASANAWFR
ncbi:hypothetical protein L7F22_019077 [Adiantum nelumboides]|nr:hypothetical protein [Adiantum nelumboides]